MGATNPAPHPGGLARPSSLPALVWRLGAGWGKGGHCQVRSLFRLSHFCHSRFSTPTRTPEGKIPERRKELEKMEGVESRKGRVQRELRVRVQARDREGEAEAGVVGQFRLLRQKTALVYSHL